MATAPFVVRVFGDPVLKQRCHEIESIDAGLLRLAEDMTTTMYTAGGVGLAGNQVGVQRRIFTYDDASGNGPRTILNPVIVETAGEWAYEEGCLSVPGIFFKITRPRHVHLQGMDLDGNAVDIEADDFLGRILQHETDHLNGLLLLDHLDPDQRKQAMRAMRERTLKETAG